MHDAERPWVFSRALTQEEETNICRAVRNAKRKVVTVALLYFYRRIVGTDFSALKVPINPTLHRIPRKQWGRICQAIMDNRFSRDPIAMTNGALDWMNLGPSAVEDEEWNRIA